MLKLTKTGIGLLTRQYRSVLKKCLLINLGVFAFSTPSYGGDLTISSYMVGMGASYGSELMVYVSGTHRSSYAVEGTYDVDLEAYMRDVRTALNNYYAKV